MPVVEEGFGETVFRSICVARESPEIFFDPYFGPPFNAVEECEQIFSRIVVLFRLERALGPERGAGEGEGVHADVDQSAEEELAPVE